MTTTAQSPLVADPTRLTTRLRIILAIVLLADVLDLMDSRSEEHTSELQSRGHLVCRLLLEKKNKK